MKNKLSMVENPSPLPKESPKIDKKLIVIIALSFLTNLVFIVLSVIDKPKKEDKQTYTLNDLKTFQPRINDLTFQPIKDGTFMSYPVSENGQLILYPIEGEAPILADKVAIGRTESSSYGVDYATSSPDLKKLAYIKDGKLWLMSSDGKEKVLISENFEVEYINSWSPDSKLLLVYSPYRDIESIFALMGYLPEKTVFQRDKRAGGFYLINTFEGKVERLEPLGAGKYTWAGPNKLIIRFGGGAYTTGMYVLFDLVEYSVDLAALKGIFENYFGNFISVSPDGKRWAIGLGNVGEGADTSYSNIIVDDFGSADNPAIEEGLWADLQHPTMAPDGKSIIYAKEQTLPNEGYIERESFVYFWDGVSSRKLAQGKPEMWVDDYRFIYTQFLDKSEKYKLFDISTGKSRDLN